MGVAYNSRIVTDGLVLALDVANQKCISPLGCTGFNNAPQLVKNIVSQSDTINSYNGVKLGNLSYYTVFAIDYPEGSYGGSAAGRDGITPGYNVTSGAKTFDFGRALNYAVYNNPTQSWVKTSVYDSYSGTAAVDTFVSEYATAVSTYPDAIHVVAGSHRDSAHTTAQYNILRDLGAPSNVDSIIGFSSPEWILVGKPGLGVGNAYGWVFQNYSTNPDQVAHLNFGLPIYGTKDNYLEFDGTDDYVSMPFETILNDCSIEVWFKATSTRSYQYLLSIGNEVNSSYSFYLDMNDPDGGGFAQTMWVYWNSGGAPYSVIPKTGTYGDWNDSTWRHYVFTRSSTTNHYMNGSLVTNVSRSGDQTTQFGNGSGYKLKIGVTHVNTNAFPGNIAQVKIYNKALTASEIQQNFNATRSRYGI